MRTSLAAARRALRSLGNRGRTTRIPDDVRRVVLAYADDARASGATWEGVAEQLGLSTTALHRWRRPAHDRSRRQRRAKPRRLVPVVLPEEALSVAAASSLTLTTAHGERLEGLAFDDALRLLRALR